MPGYGGRPTTGLNTICSLAGRGKASEGVKARSFDPIRSERVTDSNCFLQVSEGPLPGSLRWGSFECFATISPTCLPLARRMDTKKGVGGRRARCVGSESDSLELVYTFHQPGSQLKKHAFPSLARSLERLWWILFGSGSARCSKDNEH